MSFFVRMFSASAASAFAPTSGRNLSTEIERRRLSKTMPGETGARTGARYGIML